MQRCGQMAAAAIDGASLAPAWEGELGRLREQAAELPPAARRAVAQVLRSLLVEGDLADAEAWSARALLDELADDAQPASRRVVRVA